MEKLLVLLCFLALVSLSSGTLSQTPCPTTSCPWYTVEENHQGFQKRSYENTKWLTTNIMSKSIADLGDASNRLSKFCRNNGIDLKNSWPVLITVHSNESYSLSWFVPNDVNVQQGDSLIQLQIEALFKVYVRSFRGSPDLASGLSNAKALWDNLKTHLGKNCAIPTFSGATYNKVLALVHNNEIWIRENDIC